MTDSALKPLLPTLKVALLGCGVVGTEVARLLTEQADDLALRVGARLELAGIAVRRVGHRRSATIDRSLLTADPLALATRPDVDIVVEVIGGIEPARSLLLAALKGGKPVVTANKALLAENGAEIYSAAREYGADLYYEASVAGAIPLLRPLRESLAGDTVHRVLGIVNGTTNFILDRMDSSGAGFAESLDEAQALGYAEADPTADVEGFDAAAKAAILASLAFHTPVTAADVHREGITEVTATDILSARALGRVVKLLAICERCAGIGPAGNGQGVSVRVHPAMIPRSHPLASVSEAYNAVFVEAESAGRLMFYGAGAGGTPTASAVLGDIVAVARNRLAGTRGPDASTYAGLPVMPMGETLTRYHVSLDVDDKPGVLAPVAEAYARHDVSIEAVRQASRGAEAQLVIVTHTARDAALAATVRELEALPGGPRGRQRDAGGRGGRVVMPAVRSQAWKGVIAAYRDRLPVTEETPVVTLHEGGTPLLPAPVLSARTGCEVYLKVEGANPTGSFKDRGMTVAISMAAGSGAQAVICASTGNTSASAAAYAARAGLTCAVLVPRGKIAIGKLAQALVHGARLLQVDGSFDDCLELARKLAAEYPVALVNSVNPDRLQGQKTAAFEIVDELGDAPDVHCLPVGNAGNITAYWMGYTEYRRAGLSTRSPRMFGFQASGAAPIVVGRPVLQPQTIATAIRIGNPASWLLAEAARDESGGVIESVTDRDILAAYRLLATREAVFGELASSASVAGLLKASASGQIPAGSRVVCTITGNGLKDPDWALSGAPAPATIPADSAAAATALGLA